MYYSESIKIWGFIAHIPIAIVFLMFLSKQITLREKGEISSPKITNKANTQLLRKYAAGGLVGLIVLVTLSPISRFILS